MNGQEKMDEKLKKKMLDLLEELLLWALFSVIIALLPFAIHSLLILTRGDIPTATLLFSKGELVLVSSAIVASAMGSLFISGRKYKITKIIVGGLCVCVLILASAWFAIISIESNSPSFDANFASNGSIVMFVFSVISSAGCVMLRSSNR